MGGPSRRETQPSIRGRMLGKESQWPAQSTFRLLGVFEGLSSFMPRPGPLERHIHAKSSEDNSGMKFQASCMSSCQKHHHRSYNFTQGFPPVQKRDPAAIPSQLPQMEVQKGCERGGPLCSLCSSGFPEEKSA